MITSLYWLQFIIRIRGEYCAFYRNSVITMNVLELKWHQIHFDLQWTFASRAATNSFDWSFCHSLTPSKDSTKTCEAKWKHYLPFFWNGQWTCIQPNIICITIPTMCVILSFSWKNDSRNKTWFKNIGHLIKTHTGFGLVFALYAGDLRMTELIMRLMKNE